MNSALIAALAKDFVKASAVFSYGVENEIDEAADQGRDNLSQIANVIGVLSGAERQQFEAAKEAAEADFPAWIEKCKEAAAHQSEVVNALSDLAEGIQTAMAMREQEENGGLH